MSPARHEDTCPICNAVVCCCPTPDYDAVGECRCCHRFDLRAPRPEHTP
jgi:hypothetical protein